MMRPPKWFDGFLADIRQRIAVGNYADLYGLYGDLCDLAHEIDLLRAMTRDRDREVLAALDGYEGRLPRRRPAAAPVIDIATLRRAAVREHGLHVAADALSLALRRLGRLDDADRIDRLRNHRSLREARANCERTFQRQHGGTAMTGEQAARAAAVNEFIAVFDASDVAAIKVAVDDMEKRLGEAGALDVLTAAAERIRVRLEARAEVSAWAQRVADSAPPGTPFVAVCEVRAALGDTMALQFLGCARIGPPDAKRIRTVRKARKDVASCDTFFPRRRRGKKTIGPRSSFVPRPIWRRLDAGLGAL